MAAFPGQIASNDDAKGSPDHVNGYRNNRRSYQNYHNRPQMDPPRHHPHPPSVHGPLRQGVNDTFHHENGFWDTRIKSRQYQAEDPPILDTVKAEDRPVSSVKKPVQSPIGPAPRIPDQRGQQTRMPYSAALLGIGTSPSQTTIVALPTMEDKGSSPISQSLEMPPTPVLTSSQERSEAGEASEAELEAQKEEKSESIRTEEVAKVIHMDQGRTRQHQERRPLPPRECDPYGVFVSRFPEINNLEACLANFFGDCAVKSIRVQMGRTPNSSKFAFIDFYDTESTQRALTRNEAMFFGRSLNVKPKGLPNHAYSNRGGGQATRQQHGQYKTLPGRHEEAEGILKAACGLAPPMAPIEASTSPVYQSQAKTFSSSPHRYKGSTLPKNPLRGNNGRKDDAGNLAYHSSMHEQQPFNGDHYGQMAMHDGYYPYAPMYWQCPPLSPDLVLTQPTTATNSPEQSRHQVDNEVMIEDGKDKGANDVCSGKPQMGSSMPYLPYPVYDPTMQSDGMTAPCAPITPTMSMGADMVRYHWPLMTMDPSGQQYMVQTTYGGMYYPMMTMSPSQQCVPDQEQEKGEQPASRQMQPCAEKNSNGIHHEQYQKGTPFPSPQHPNGFNGHMNHTAGIPMMSVPFPQPIYPMPMQYGPGATPYGGQQMQIMPNQGIPVFASQQMRSWNANKHNGQNYTSIPQDGVAKQDVFGDLDADNKPISIPAWMNDCS